MYIQQTRSSAMRTANFFVVAASFMAIGCSRQPSGVVSSLQPDPTPNGVRKASADSQDVQRKLGASVLHGLTRQPAEDDVNNIYEIVSLSLIRGFEPDWIFFLSLNEDDDPPEALLGRFADLEVKVRKGSRAETIEPSNIDDPVYFDRITNEPGVRLVVRILRWIDQNRVEVEGHYYVGQLFACKNVYTLGKSRGRWEILRKIKRSVS
jgi:hypothetical protein